MTSSVKQVKISTSILWLLNKAQARKVFFSSMDIYADRSNLHLHSLIVRGLVSGELYSAALSKLFPNAHKIVRTKDFQSIINFVVELDTMHLEEVSIVRQKERETQVKILTGQNPFEISEHLQMIDAIMAVNLTQSDMVLAIPNILGKLCEFRPTTTDPKKLLELWFKSISCLSLSKKYNKNLLQLVKLIITEASYENDVDGQYLETIKFSDKLALIISFDCDFIGIDEDFLFDYSPTGSTDRNNIKHNFMTVLNVFRKKFPKVLEDFKEMMLVLNSSHVQISSNMLINIDTFMLEFFSSIDEYSNHGNRTFRTTAMPTVQNDSVNNIMSRMDKSGPMTNDSRTYCSQTINKPPSYFKENFSTTNAFGTYSGRRVTPNDMEDPTTKQNSMNWISQTPASNLLNGSRKKSLPAGLDGLNDKRMVSSEVLLPDGCLKTAFIDRRKENEELDVNKTSWLEQLEKSQKTNSESWKTISSDQEETKPRVRVNETRLRLNLKRKEIERNRHQLQQKSAKELQVMSDQAFKDVALRSGRGDAEEAATYRPKRLSDMKKSENHSGKKDLVRSRSQELSKPTVDEISASINLLKSEISKLTSEQAKLTAKLEDNRSVNTDAFSPRTASDNMSRDRDSESSIYQRSVPNTWNARSMYGNEERYHPQFQYPYSYQYEHQNPQFQYPYSAEQYHQFYTPRYHQEFANAQYNQRHESRHMAKSVQESTNSRVSSPVAISEPTKLLEENLISPKKQATKEVELLTVNNLLKHNESMEIITTQDHSENWIKRVSKEDVNSTAVEIKLEEENVVEITKETVKNDNDLAKEAVQAFYVSFNDEDSAEGSKTPRKPPKPLTIRRNNVQDDVPSPNIKNKSDKVVVKEPLKREKPVAFVIPAEDEEISTKNTDVDLSVKDKLAQRSEKREQERKEKLEKIRELARCECEKRLEKETEKEKSKQEKEMKRKAIFEAYLEKKVEKEVTDKSSRRDIRLPKKLNRAVSAAPLQRHELDNSVTNNSSNTPPSEIQSPTPKPEKLGTTTSGTKLFVTPKSKSNKGVILNAIKYCCLAGKVNEDLKQQTIEDLEKCDVSHCMVLMRGGCQYRSLYGFNPETEVLLKISGMGPKKITSKMIERFYKYNSGSKKFTEINSTSHLSTVIDGITIFNTLWKSTIPSCGQLLSSETSSQAEQMSQ